MTGRAQTGKNVSEVLVCLFIYIYIYIYRKIQSLENFLLLFHYKAINYNGSDLPIHSVLVKGQVAGFCINLLCPDVLVIPLRNELLYNLIP